jgi:hypothetical protein
VCPSLAATRSMIILFMNQAALDSSGPATAGRSAAWAEVFHAAALAALSTRFVYVDGSHFLHGSLIGLAGAGVWTRRQFRGSPHRF